jgi:hypothetical protein
MLISEIDSLFCDPAGDCGLARDIDKGYYLRYFAAIKTTVS